jgi:hypothetical protein
MEAIFFLKYQAVSEVHGVTTQKTIFFGTIVGFLDVLHPLQTAWSNHRTKVKRLLGKPSHRWKDSIEMHLKEICSKGVEKFHLSEDRV